MKKFNLLLMTLMLIFAAGLYAQDIVYLDFDRTGWKADAPSYSPTDDAVGGEVAGPKYLLDDNTKTFLALVKPGKSYRGTPGPDLITDLGFVINMGEAGLFDYFRIQYNSGNLYDYLRPWQISIYGSNDAAPTFTTGNWTQIKDKDSNSVIPLPNAEGNGAPYTSGNIDLENAASYRFIKVVYEGMSPSTNGSTLQVAEFYVGKTTTDKVIENPGDVNFGDIQKGISAKKTLAIKGFNLNNLSYTISGSDASAFSYVKTGTPTSTSDSIIITFAPVERKSYTAEMTITMKDVLEPQTIQLIGNADFDLPIQLSDASNEHWYYIQFARQSAENKVLTVIDPAVVDPTVDGDSIKQLPMDLQNSNQQWKITGTWDNYTLVNKSNKTVCYVHKPAGEDPGTGLPIPEVNSYVAKPLESGDMFGFVRYKTTDTWQLKNTSSAVASEVKKIYFNDQSGITVGGSTLNNAGNQLKFISADSPGFVVPGDTVSLGSVNQNQSEVLGLQIGSVKVTENITVAITKDEDQVFTLNTSTLPSEGGKIEITFSPKAYKTISYATVSLTSGSLTHSFVVSATSDVGLSKYYVGTVEQWGTPVDGEVVGTIPTSLKAGDKVWIAKGEYTTGQINVPADVEFYGSFAGTETSLEQRAIGEKPWEFTHQTVLKNSSPLILSITGANVIVDGITFEGTSVIGRAIQNTNSSAVDVIIRNNIIKNFTSEADGGGMNIRYRTEIYNCLITGNKGNKGGAGYLEQVTIHDCEITQNSVPLDAKKPIGSVNGGGGGLLLAPGGDGCRAYNLYISGNKASFGGGVFLRAGAQLYNSVIVENSVIGFSDEEEKVTYGSGSGIAFDERDNNVTVYNVIIANNISEAEFGVGVCFSAGLSNRTQKLYNSILYNNTDPYSVINIGVCESDVKVGRAIPEIKNIIIDDAEWYASEDGPSEYLVCKNSISEDDPTKLFVGDTWVTASTSPGIDKGFIELTTEIVDEETGETIPATYLEFATGKDLAGNQRIVNTIDIGPYENQIGASVDRVTPDLEGRVIDTKYYNIQGIEVGIPTQDGIYIKKELLDTNKVRSTKVLIVVREK